MSQESEHKRRSFTDDRCFGTHLAANSVVSRCGIGKGTCLSHLLQRQGTPGHLQRPSRECQSRESPQFIDIGRERIR